MGIYDRDYYRQEQRPEPFRYAPRTIVGWLIVVNLAVWLMDGLFVPRLHELLAVHNSNLAGPFHYTTLTHPLYWWQFLTAGFTHEPAFGHILGNMLVLFFLGRDVEERDGRKEFLWLYLATLVFANVIWSVANKITGLPAGIEGPLTRDVMLIGASGAIAGIVVLYALNFPNRTLLLYFVIPMPAWLLGAIVVAYDIYGAMGGVAGSNVAYSVHLAGAAFALLYYKRGWNLTRLAEERFRWPRLPWIAKPRLRVHRPEDEPSDSPDAELNLEVDRILEKIGRYGEAGLTVEERRTLETASRKYRSKMTSRE